MHEVLVNRLGGLSLPRKSVVRLTDRPDMTLDVYRGRKTTIQPQIKTRSKRDNYIGDILEMHQTEFLHRNGRKEKLLGALNIENTETSYSLMMQLPKMKMTELVTIPFFCNLLAALLLNIGALFNFVLHAVFL